MYPRRPHVHIVYAVSFLHVVNVKTLTVISQYQLQRVLIFQVCFQLNIRRPGVLKTVIQFFFKYHDQVPAYIQRQPVFPPSFIGPSESEVDLRVLE